MQDKSYGFKFQGSGSEFFKIWATNVSLSFITLGLYSPWAKVRTNAYIYGNTTLNGDSFEYTASPIKILIGRLIVVSIFILHFILGEILWLKTYAAMVLLCFFALLPWLIRQAVRFRARYTRYRGINFRHEGTIWQYYKFFIIHFLLNIVTLSLAFPYTLKEFRSLVFNNTFYGDKKFIFSADTSSFYKMFLKYIGIILAATLALVVIFILLTKIATNSIAFGMLTSIFLYLSFIFAISFFKGVFSAWLGNLIYNNLKIHNFTFESCLKGKELGMISFTNTLLVLITFGLYYPYAKIKTLTYKIEHVNLFGSGFDEFINQNIQESATIGEETADFFDIDIGI